MRRGTLSGTKAVLGEAFPMRKVLHFKPGETMGRDAFPGDLLYEHQSLARVLD